MLTTKQTDTSHAGPNNPTDQNKISPETINVKSQHKLEGKNKKSLHQKQQQQQQSSSSVSNQQQTSSSRRQHHQKTQNLSNKSPGSSSTTSNSSGSLETNNDGPTNNVNCVTLEDFSKRAFEIKSDICKALEKQANHEITDTPIEVVNLKNDILKLSEFASSGVPSGLNNLTDQNEETSTDTNKSKSGDKTQELDIDSKLDGHNGELPCSSQISDHQVEHDDGKSKETCTYKSDTILSHALDNLTMQPSNDKEDTQIVTNKIVSKSSKQTSSKRKPLETDCSKQQTKNTKNDDIEPLLRAKLDTNSKVVALISSLQKLSDTDQVGINQSLNLVCRKLVDVSEENAQLSSDNESFRIENHKLTMIRDKLENLCRELQKSNNAIRIESLDLIKVEQGKAKEQTTKIQSTLSGVIKLFDENQQRNMSLRQENQELQSRLKSLLEHCDNWEKSVEVAMRQRDIENRLIKTELAKANLIKNEEKEKFLGEKQELLQLLSMMQEQQHRIEGQEAKLRSDLSSYASKYDECQAVISKGMNRFQTESKKMLKQIEKSKQDYKVLLSKYESSNRKMAQLLEEKQSWDKAMNVANKKILTLEKLCRALKEQKIDVKTEASGQKSNSFNNKTNKSINSKKQKETTSKDISAQGTITLESESINNNDAIDVTEEVREETTSPLLSS